MGHTIIGVFRHSGDADLAAAHLREDFALEASEIDVIGAASWDELGHPAPEGPSYWVLAATTAIGLNRQPYGDEEPIGKRWGDKLWEGQTLVVARTGDPAVAQEMAKEMHQTGADHVDLLPH